MSTPPEAKYENTNGISVVRLRENSEKFEMNLQASFN